MELAKKSLSSAGQSMEAMDDEDEYTGPRARCVLFTLDSEIYGIHVKKIREVLRVGKIRDVAGSDYNVLGVINVRGVIVTVIDVRVMFGMPSKEVTDLSRIIIVELDDERTVGMLVDFVMEVKDIPENRFEALSSTKDNASKYIQSIAHFEDNVIILIEVDNMFG
ncbi:chemotaxis protein CheW [Thiomicrorhabdus lithotrophica]|uniref:Chemotaxis protein CheW n=1 Tax=Thiomicrorhabdus lithotrophica TaxID=2949997 RepID=A0ABY8CBN9_9GAMM|nr:chemotaxis protein CheW [Thiomicrorhabdus lithotrophica]WEJ63398.1 chemotaxis protein CheW [Thiomicrorhabdus lithotrophica]